MSTLRAAAAAAHQAAQSATTTEHRDQLATVLEPYDVSTLEVAHVETSEKHTLVVFTDGDVDLAVRSRPGGTWQVTLVNPDDQGGWTRLADVTSLAELGALLPRLDPQPEPDAAPAWVQPTGAHDAYALGDRVTHKGATWESLVGGNVWEPGKSGWREVAR